MPVEWEPKDQIVIALEQLREIVKKWPNPRTIAANDGELLQKILDIKADLQGIDSKSLILHPNFREIRTLTKYMLTLEKNLQLQRKQIGRF
jgi:hypothetical protein